MKIEILSCEKGEKEPVLLKFDVKIVYSLEKWEIFRNLKLLAKNGKKWVNLPVCKVDDKWLPVYEREPKWPSSEVLRAILEHSSNT